MQPRPAAMAEKPILASKQAAEVVRGVPTEVVCTAFANTVLVVVTQYGKMGTLVSVEPNVVADGLGTPLLATKVLLGKDEVCAVYWLIYRCSDPAFPESKTSLVGLWPDPTSLFF